MIVVHCSATRVNQNFSIEDLEACHKETEFVEVDPEFITESMQGKKVGGIE